MKRRYASAIGIVLIALALAGCQRGDTRGGADNAGADGAGATGRTAVQSAQAASAERDKNEKAAPSPAAGSQSKDVAAPRQGPPIKDENVKPATHVEVTDQPSAWEDDLPPRMPSVVMSHGHAATCLVKVGQTLPDVSLPDLEGRPQQLSKLMGERATVLVVWASANVHAATELGDLAVDVASPLAARGVRVVGVNERDDAGAAKKTAEAAGASYPILLDADGRYFAQLATEGLPRTYLVDGAGKVLWLDMEYSRSTRRDLRQALRLVLEGP